MTQDDSPGATSDGPLRVSDYGHMTNLRLPNGDLEHRYGPNVHVVARPSLVSLLARASDARTSRRELSRLTELLYGQLAMLVADRELPAGSVHGMYVCHTPMERYVASKAHLQTLGVKPNQRVIIASLARAGMDPSQVVLDTLDEFLDEDCLRLDTFSSERQSDGKGGVTSRSVIAGAKIGADCTGATLIVADPIGATGSTFCQLMECYAAYRREHGEDGVEGGFARVICLHLVVASEYLRRITREFPDVTIYTVRVDRGLSSYEVLSATPGARWDEEVGLTPAGYLVPGVGDFGRRRSGGNI